jgi:hypothetical protein
MFRVRAVESPANAEGVRTIWHRGPRGAELVTDIDATGRVLRQRLTILDDVLLWRREQGLSLAVEPAGAGALRLGTGAAAHEVAATGATATGVPGTGATANATAASSSPTGAAPSEAPLDAGRLSRAAASLGFYTGPDRFLAHLRDQVLAAHPPPMAVARPGTPPGTPRERPRSAGARWVLALGVALALATLILALLRSTS